MIKPYLYKIKLPMGMPQYGAFNKEEAAETGCGCDAFMYVSILFPPDGSLSIQFAGMDGRTQKPLSDVERWKVWVLLAKELSESKEFDDDDGRKITCAAVIEAVNLHLKTKKI